MKKQSHLLSDLWDDYPELMTKEEVVIQANPVGQYLAEMLAMGSFYYYMINISDYSLHNISSTIFSIHGLPEYPQTLQQIINLIHPEDLAFVVAAEKATLEKIRELGQENQLNLKSSYCFRMKTADGSYQLFYHQAIHLTKDEEGRLTTSLNIHTNIQHITQVNNFIVLVNGIGDRSDYCRIDLSEKDMNPTIPKLSKREMEVLCLIGQGLSSLQIGKKLFISEETVRVHRKHLLKKTATNNSSNLIKKCIELSLL